MDRAKSYSWLLTVIMGVALTTAVRELSVLIATPSGANTATIAIPLTRFAIFLLLSIRWTLGTLWYFDRAYISKVPPPPTLGSNYFFDFFKAFINFLVFVPLALTVTSAPASASPLASWLNIWLLGGKEVSTFIWIIILLLAYDFILFLVKCLLWLVLSQVPLRIHAFWALINFLTLIFCVLIFLFRAFLGKDPQGSELPIFYVILFASIIDLVGTVIEDSPLSRRLSP